MKSKNKLVPRLLGITKESVMRVDERTKDVVQEWPLTTVKRWAASPKSFTLVRHTGTSPADLDCFSSLISSQARCFALFAERAGPQEEDRNEHAVSSVAVAKHSLCCPRRGGGHVL